LNRPYSRNQPAQPQHRINGRIRARDVRVIGPDEKQVGVLDLAAAINLARQYGMDLVEIAATANPPVCRIVDYGKFKYELAKKERDSKKTQHSNQVKEIQLSASIDPHDLRTKTQHAIEFLCEDMKVKASLRFRGREMAHPEVGKGVVDTFLRDLAPWGQTDFPPKLVGKVINVMISPLPRTKRAKNPNGEDSGTAPDAPAKPTGPTPAPRVDTDAASNPSGFGSSPFEGLELPPADKPEPNA
jgi:translation initiation factor IF-3